MIELGVDFELENLLAKYRRIGASMPLLVRDYNNRMAFNTRKLSVKTLRDSMIVRASFRFITSGRALSVRKAKFSRDIQRIEAEVGGRVVPGSRDPNFMARLEHGGRIPADRFGRTGIPTVKGARSGSRTKLISSGRSVPKIAASAVSNRKGGSTPKQRRAIAMAVAIRERKKFARMTDRQGRDSLYSVKGTGRGRKRKISEVVKLWTLSRGVHASMPKKWLSRAVKMAVASRVKVFRRVAEQQIRRRALRGK